MATEVKNLLTRRHPHYLDSVAHWDFCELSYRGGRAWFNEGNIFKFHKEGEREYEARLKRAFRANHVKRVVTVINEYLFKQRPLRQDISEVPLHIRDFWRKATLEGKTIDSLMEEIDAWSSVFGMLYVVVDRPANTPKNMEEQRRAGNPYAYIVTPQRVLDLSYNQDDGLLNWIVIHETRRADSDPFASDGDTHDYIKVWDRQKWTLVKIDSLTKGEGTIESSAEHGLGIVPVIPVAMTNGSRYCSPGLIDDAVYMDRAVANYAALIDEILYEQTFSQLILPAEALPHGVTENDMVISASTKRVLLYNSASPGSKPEFISPDPKQASLIADSHDKLMREIYSSTGTDYEGNSQSMSTGKSYASGKVRQFDFMSIENLLSRKSKVCESVEDQLMTLVDRWMGGEETFEPNPKWVVYPTKFDIRGLTAELEIAKQIFELSPPESIMREQMRIVVDKGFSRLSPGERDKLYADIDAWKPVYKEDSARKDREVDLQEAQIASSERMAKEAADRQAAKPDPVAA